MTASPRSDPRPRRRGTESIRDIVLSMAVVGIVVAATYWVVAWQRPEVQGTIRPAVDVERVVTQVQEGGSFAVLEPKPPSGWTATSAWFETDVASGVGGGVLHVGYVTPEDSYAEVKQTDATTADALDEWIDDVDTVGDLEIDGVTWRQVESASSGRQGLVLVRDGEQPPVTVVVTGKAGVDELAELAGSLS